MSNTIFQGNVEVQNQSTLAWYSAKVIDYQNQHFTVRHEYFPEESNISVERVRLQQPITQVEAQKLTVGYQVEVATKNSEQEPPGWWIAEIKGINKGQFFVHYLNYDSSFDEVVDVKRLRVPSSSKPFQAGQIKRASFTIPTECSNLSIESKEKIEKAGERLKSLCISEENGQLIVVGFEGIEIRAQQLFDIIFQNQKQLNKIDKQNEEKMKQLEQKKEKAEREYSVQINIPAEYTGMIIGKKGERINSLQKTYQCQIKINQEKQEKQGQMAQVICVGENREKVDQCVKLISLRRDQIQIPLKIAQWVSNYQLSIIKDIKHQCRLTDIWLGDIKPEQGFVGSFEQKGNNVAVNFVGNDEGIKSAASLLEIHLSFYDQYQKNQQAIEKANQQLSELKQNPIYLLKQSLGYGQNPQNLQNPQNSQPKQQKPREEKNQSQIVQNTQKPQQQYVKKQQKEIYRKKANENPVEEEKKS